MHVEVDRQSDPSSWPRLEADLARVLGDVPPRRRRLAGDARPRSVRSLADLTPAPPRCRPQRARRRRGLPAAGWPTTISRLLGYSSYALEAECRSALQLRASRARPRASCATKRRGELSRSFACPAGRGARPRRASPRRRSTVTKANTRSTVHRATYLDFIGVKRFAADGTVVGRAPLPRPVHLGRLQPEPAPDPAAAPQGRAGGRALPASPRDRARRQGAAPHPRDLPARRAVPDRRGPSCSRSRPTSCTCRTARGCACSCAPDPFGALCRLPRLRAARPLQHRRCASGCSTSWSRRCGGRDTEFQAQVSRIGRSRASCSLVRTPHGVPSRPRRGGARAHAGRGLPQLARPAPGSADRGRAARSTATGCSRPSAAPSRPPTRSASSRAPPSPTSRASTGCRRRTAGDLAMSLYRRLEDPQRRCCASS